MDTNKLDRSIRELNRRIKSIKEASQRAGNNDLFENVVSLEERTRKFEEDYYHAMDRWKRIELSRLEMRPQTLDYISLAFDDFIELKGDRLFRDDTAVIGGLATFRGRKVVVVGNQKGRGLKARLFRNFGMPHPEGYRKAVRLMELAEKFNLPLVTMIDTPGAFPGVEAEMRGQSIAIAQSMAVMVALKVPIVAIVIGEGGSGGALALGVANRVFMMENASYSVVSPEACASILWKDRKMKKSAAEALKSTAQDNLALGLIDEIIPEPVGGAHRDHGATAKSLGDSLEKCLEEIGNIPLDTLLTERYERTRRMGIYHEITR